MNKIGIRINRSIHILHDKFKELLTVYTINEKYIEPLKAQLLYTWDNLTETNSDYKKSISLKLNEVQGNLETMEKNHALGKVRMDIFEKYSEELITEKKKLSEELEKLSQKLSNPKGLIDFSVNIASKLATAWTCGDYHEKQMFQNMVFPKGLAFDSQIDDYRTPISNSVFGYIAHLSKCLEEIKSGASLNLLEKSRSVPGIGLEPIQSQ